MNHTQREVEQSVHLLEDQRSSMWGHHRVTQEVQREVEALYPLCDSPVIAYPYSRMLFCMDIRGNRMPVPYECITAIPKYVPGDASNYSDDTLHFSKYPLIAHLDEA